MPLGLVLTIPAPTVGGGTLAQPGPLLLTLTLPAVTLVTGTGADDGPRWPVHERRLAWGIVEAVSWAAGERSRAWPVAGAALEYPVFERLLTWLAPEGRTLTAAEITWPVAEGERAWTVAADHGWQVPERGTAWPVADDRAFLVPGRELVWPVEEGG